MKRLSVLTWLFGFVGGNLIEFFIVVELSGEHIFCYVIAGGLIPLMALVTGWARNYANDGNCTS